MVFMIETRILDSCPGFTGVIESQRFMRSYLRVKE